MWCLFPGGKQRDPGGPAEPRDTAVLLKKSKLQTFPSPQRKPIYGRKEPAGNILKASNNLKKIFIGWM